MRSRYDLMTESCEVADDGTKYRDICSAPLRKFVFSEAPTDYYLTEKDIERIDLLVYRYYGVCEFDDILLWLNGISNIYDCEAGDKILIPAKADMENFYYKYRV
jgi:hypothetical protein